MAGKSNPRASFIKAGALLLIMIFLVIVMNVLSSKRFPAAFREMASLNMLQSSKVDLFTEQEQDSIRKACAGFYEMVPDTGIDTGRFSLSDRIELKSNGIIWEVRQYRIRMPSGDSIVFKHALNSYLYPWSRRKTETGVKTLTEIRIIYQAMIGNNDTCYGESHVDYVADFEKRGADLYLFGRQYVPYTGALKDFFPAGATKMVDDVRLKKCLSFNSFIQFSFDRVAAALGSGAGAKADSASVAALVRDYYAPLMWQGIVERFPVEELVLNTPAVRTQFTVDSRGLVASSRILGGGPVPTAIERYITDMQAKWRFPAGAGNVNGTYEFKF